MGLPVSRTAFNRLGERLAASEDIGDEDDALLERCLAAYDEVKEIVVRGRLADLGYAATARTKTTGTLVEKLRREKGAKLANVQDVAGCRITVDGSRLDQDAVVARIVDAFPDGTKPPHIIDRRERPSAGYRAVHVVVWVDGLPVEVQVRTPLQDVWAQVTERLADIWGRAIRYGGEPDDADSEAWEGWTRSSVVRTLGGLSRVIDTYEDFVVVAMRLEPGIASTGSAKAREAYEEVLRQSEALEAAFRGYLQRLLRSAERLG